MNARSNFVSRLALLGLFISLCQNGSAAVGFANTPAAVGNTYSGAIRLVVSGLPTGASVIVQKYLDANNNGAIDAGDTLMQQFNLTDGQAGMVIGGVTNFNVPGDTDTVAGQITAKLILQTDFSQLIVGNYLFRLSSPSNAFTPITNSLVVTNVSYAQKFTGTVLSNGVAVPYAAVLLLQPTGGGDVNPVGGTVANGVGVYSIAAPPGTYGLLPFQSNFVASAAAVSGLVLGNGATITTNLTLIPATQTISGRVVDANTSAGLPGFLLAAQSKSQGLLAITHTDAGGNFSVGVTSNQWKLSGDSAGEAFAGYVGLANNPAVSTTSGSVSGVTVALPKATALVYGTLKDVFGNPVPGVVAIYAEDQNISNYNNTYQSDGYTFTNGDFVIAVVGGLGPNDLWQVSVDNAEAFPNYNFSHPLSEDNYNGTNIGAGQAIEINIAAEAAANYISGNVQYNGTNLAGLTINANSQDTNSFQAQTTTDNNGDYSLLVGNGVWSVTVNCQGGDNDSLQSILGNNNFVCPCGPNVTISNNNATGVNIQVTSGGSGQVYGYLTNVSGGGISGIMLSFQDQCSGQGYSATTGGNGFYSISIPYGTYNVSVDCGGLNSQNYQCVNETNVTLSSGSVELDFTAQSSGGGGGQPNLYGWVEDPSANEVVGLQVSATDGAGASYSTTTDQNGYYSFHVANGFCDVSLSCPGLNSLGYACISDQITNINADSVEVDFTVQPGNSASSLEIQTSYLPDVLVGMPYFQQLLASGGQAPYVWSLDSGSLPLPPGVNLFSNGVVYGSMTSADLGTNYFLVDVTDNSGNTTSQFLSLAVFPPLLISSNALPSGTVGQAYNAQIIASGGTVDFGIQITGEFPPGLNINYGATTSSNQVFLISGTPTNSGTFTFTFILYDEVYDPSFGSYFAEFETQTNFTITIGAANLQITTASALPTAIAGIYYSNQLQASGGTPPYTWAIANGSQQPPASITLSSSGLLSGVPETAGTNSFVVRLTDHNALTVTRTFKLVTNPVLHPGLAAIKLSNGQFQLRITGSASQDYLVETTTNLLAANWTALFVTNSATTNSFIIVDSSATNKAQFYRVILAP